MSPSPLESCSCLCGAVSYRVRLTSNEVAACHCRMCQKWAGGISLAIDCDPGIEINDTRYIGVYVSSDWGERAFCTRCGSPLFWRTRDGSVANIPPSALDKPGVLRFSTEFCIDRKPDYYGFDVDTKRLTEAEMMALYTDAGGETHG